MNAHIAYFLAALPVIWAFNKVGDWSTKWTLGVTFANGAVMVLSALAAALLPYRAKKLYEASPGATFNVGSIPTVTIVGVLGFLLGGFMVAASCSFPSWDRFHQQRVPLHDRGRDGGAPLIIYFVMRSVRQARASRWSTRSRRSHPNRPADPRGGRARSRPIAFGGSVDRARAVVIGGGVTGCSVAYHLARAGWSDVLLLDKGELTSGSTAHAAGLVATFNPSPTMMRFRRYSIDLYRELGVFDEVGSLRFASSPEQLKELERGVSRRARHRLGSELVSAVEASASDAGRLGSRPVRRRLDAEDGFLDPTRRDARLGCGRPRARRADRHGRSRNGIELGPHREVEVLSPRAVISSVRWWSTPPDVGAAWRPWWPRSCRRRRSIIGTRGAAGGP